MVNLVVTLTQFVSVALISILLLPMENLFALESKPKLELQFLPCTILTNWLVENKSLIATMGQMREFLQPEVIKITQFSYRELQTAYLTVGIRHLSERFNLTMDRNQMKCMLKLIGKTRLLSMENKEPTLVLLVIPTLASVRK